MTGAGDAGPGAVDPLIRHMDRVADQRKLDRIAALEADLAAARAEVAKARNDALEEAAKIALLDWTPAYGPHDNKMERFAELQREGIAGRIRDGIRAARTSEAPDA